MQLEQHLTVRCLQTGLSLPNPVSVLAVLLPIGISTCHKDKGASVLLLLS